MFLPRNVIHKIHIHTALYLSVSQGVTKIRATLERKKKRYDKFK